MTMNVFIWYLGCLLVEPFGLEPQSSETKKWVRYLLEDRAADTQDALQNARHYVPRFRNIFKNEGIPVDLVWIALVESGFRKMATNPSGAKGMFQFKVPAGRAFGLTINRQTDQRFHPEAAAKAAARYLAYLREKFSSWELVLAAYNLGEGDLRRTMSKHGAKHWAQVKPYVRSQTQDYIGKIRAAALIGNDFIHKHPLSLHSTQTTYQVRKGDTLYAISRRFKVDIETLIHLNSLPNNQIRPGRYLLIPKGSDR